MPSWTLCGRAPAIRYNCRSYDKLNVARFYTKLQTLRSQLSGAGTDSNTSAGTDTAPQS